MVAAAATLGVGWLAGGERDGCAGWAQRGGCRRGGACRWLLRLVWVARLMMAGATVVLAGPRVAAGAAALACRSLHSVLVGGP